MLDFKLDSSGDLAVEDGDFVLLEGAEAVQQRVAIRLRMLYGEWFLNLEEGFPYREAVLGKGRSLSVIQGLFRRAIATTPGIVRVDSLEVEHDRSARSLSVTWSATATEGPVEGDVTYEL